MDVSHITSVPRERRLSTVERAFELARNGSCRTVDEIVRRLKEEQFDCIDSHLGGTSIRKDLRQACADSRSLRLRPAEPPELAAE